MLAASVLLLFIDIIVATAATFVVSFFVHSIFYSNFILPCLWKSINFITFINFLPQPIFSVYIYSQNKNILSKIANCCRCILQNGFDILLIFNKCDVLFPYDSSLLLTWPYTLHRSNRLSIKLFSIKTILMWYCVCFSFI